MANLINKVILTKKEYVRVNLNEFLENVYNIDWQKIQDYDNFYFDNDSSRLEIDKDIFATAKKLFPKVDTDLIELEIKRCMFDNYESSYMSEYIEEYKKQLSNKIIEDFNNLIEFFSEELTDFNYTPGINKIEVSINWNNEYIDILCNTDLLASIVIQCINNYGLFEYTSLKDFYSSYPCKNLKMKKDYTIKHLHWLHKLEEIYGSVYNFFKFDSKHVDYYGTMGNYDITIEDVKMYIESEI